MVTVNLEQLYFFIFQILSFHLTSFVDIYLSLTIAADRGTLKNCMKPLGGKSPTQNFHRMVDFLQSHFVDKQMVLQGLQKPKLIITKMQHDWVPFTICALETLT